jgi:hypothetical protein
MVMSAPLASRRQQSWDAICSNVRQATPFHDATIPTVVDGSLVLSVLYLEANNAAHVAGLLTGLGAGGLLIHRRSWLLTAAGVALPLLAVRALAATAAATFTPHLRPSRRVFASNL